MIKRFDDDPTRYTRALQIWQILIAQAVCSEQTITYGALAKILGFKGAGTLGNFLDPVMRYCREKGLPPLTVIVVNQETGKLGPGLPGIVDRNTDQDRVFNYPWFSIIPPTPQEFEEAHKKDWIQPIVQ